VTRGVDGIGPIAGASGTATGYEIHMGRSTPTAAVERPLGPESVATERVLGTYLHGLFENASVREAFVEAVFNAAGTSRPAGMSRPAGTDVAERSGEEAGATADPYTGLRPSSRTTSTSVRSNSR